MDQDAEDSMTPKPSRERLAARSVTKTPEEGPHSPDIVSSPTPSSSVRSVYVEIED